VEKIRHFSKIKKDFFKSGGEKREKEEE
jgi:hypothetical protein